MSWNGKKIMGPFDNIYKLILDLPHLFINRHSQHWFRVKRQVTPAADCEGSDRRSRGQSGWRAIGLSYNQGYSPTEMSMGSQLFTPKNGWCHMICSAKAKLVVWSLLPSIPRHPASALAASAAVAAPNCWRQWRGGKAVPANLPEQR